MSGNVSNIHWVNVLLFGPGKWWYVFLNLYVWIFLWINVTTWWATHSHRKCCQASCLHTSPPYSTEIFSYQHAVSHHLCRDNHTLRLEGFSACEFHIYEYQHGAKQSQPVYEVRDWEGKAMGTSRQKTSAYPVVSLVYLYYLDYKKNNQFYHLLSFSWQDKKNTKSKLLLVIENTVYINSK